MMLFHSTRAREVDFDSMEFRQLFNIECNIVCTGGWTALMSVCKYNPRKLNSDLWFLPELFEKVGCRDIHGCGALIKLFNSEHIAEVDLEGKWFK